MARLYVRCLNLLLAVYIAYCTVQHGQQCTLHYEQQHELPKLLIHVVLKYHDRKTLTHLAHKVSKPRSLHQEVDQTELVVAAHRREGHPVAAAF